VLPIEILAEAIGRCSDHLTQGKGVGNHAFSYPLRLIIHRINEDVMLVELD